MPTDNFSDISEQYDDGLLPGIDNQLKSMTISVQVFEERGVLKPEFKRLFLSFVKEVCSQKIIRLWLR